MNKKRSKKNNIMLKKNLVLCGGVVLGVGMMYAGYKYIPPKKELKSKISNNLKALKNIVEDQVLYSLSSDPLWEELADRASEFRLLCPNQFKELVIAMANVVEFEIQVTGNLTRGTPRMFRTYLHEVVECVRDMRAEIEHKCASALNDFDEIAADIQKTHDDVALNMQYDCAL